MVILLWGAGVVLVGAVVVVLWQMAEWSIQSRPSRSEVKALADEVKRMRKERKELLQRIEHLESIVASDSDVNKIEGPSY